jgi:hypothetical protein
MYHLVVTFCPCASLVSGKNLSLHSSPSLSSFHPFCTFISFPSFCHIIFVSLLSVLPIVISLPLFSPVLYIKMIYVDIARNVPFQENNNEK